MSLRIAHGGGAPPPVKAELDPSGILMIHCRECTAYPDAGSPACVRCITSSMSRVGTADRVQLKAGKDTEISGPAAEILCDMASLSRVMLPASAGPRCASCARSPEKVMSSAWSDFPEPSFKAAADRLYTEPGDGPGCANCLQRTHSALMIAEANMERVRRKASRIAAAKGAGE